MRISQILDNNLLKIDCLYNELTGSLSYILIDKETSDCAVVDPVINYDSNSKLASTKPSDEIIDYISKRYLNLEWILETNIHFNHLSGANYIKSKLGGRIATSDLCLEISGTWSSIFNLVKNFSVNPLQFDYLFGDGEKFFIGNIEVKTIHTPGHSPVSTSFAIGDYVFVGNTILTPELGTARTDIIGSDPKIAFGSIQKILALPDQNKIFSGYDSLKTAKQNQLGSTIQEQKKHNIVVNENMNEEKYLEARSKKDLDNPLPVLLLPAVYFNLSVGRIDLSKVKEIENATTERSIKKIS